MKNFFLCSDCLLRFMEQYDNYSFQMILKKSVKNGYLKSRNLSEEKKTHPSTNIPLLSYRKSEQKIEFVG